MRKLILTGLSFLFAITLTFAQEVTPEQKAKQTVTVLTEKLALNQGQQDSIYAIVLDAENASLALSADTTLSADDVKKQSETILTTTSSKIEALLTDEQKAAYTALLSGGKKESEGNQEDTKE